MSDDKKVVLNQEVVALLEKAVGAGITVFESTKAAASLAAVELDMDKPAAESTKEVIDRYSEVYGSDHNVKSIFGDALYLAYCGRQPITFKTKPNRKGESEEIHTDADSVLSGKTKLSHSNFKRAASEARANNGDGRASGGGRKGNATKADTTPSKPVTVFSTIELNSQLAGLFAHTKNPIPTLNKSLKQYRLAVVSEADLAAFKKWKAANTKTAK